MARIPKRPSKVIAARPIQSNVIVITSGILCILSVCIYTEGGKTLHFDNTSRNLVTYTLSVSQLTLMPSIVNQSRTTPPGKLSSTPSLQHLHSRDSFLKPSESKSNASEITKRLIDRKTFSTSARPTVESGNMVNNAQWSDVLSTAHLSTRQPLSMADQNNFADVKLFYENCSFFSYQHLFYEKGRVYGMFGDLSHISARSWCKWCLHVPEGFEHMYVLITMPQEPCFGDHALHISSSPSRLRSPEYIFTCNAARRQILGEAKQDLYFTFITRLYQIIGRNVSGVEKENPMFVIQFDAYKVDVRKHLSISYDTSQTGHITQWGYDETIYYLCTNNASHVLMLPNGHVVMLSFPRFDMPPMFNDCPHAGLWLHSVNDMQNLTLIAHYCGQLAIPTDVFATSLLFHFKTQKKCKHGGFGFKAFFSFHPMSSKPQKLEKGFFNCSAPTYHMFKKHLECNLQYECTGHRDEGEHCPYSNKHCKGLVSSGKKCYSYVGLDNDISFYAAQKECLRRNADLAMMKTESEWNDFMQIFQYAKVIRTSWIGVRSGDSSLPDVYKYMMKWVDSSIAQNVHVIPPLIHRTSYHRKNELCALIYKRQKLHMDFVLCSKNDAYYFFCQHGSEQNEHINVTFPVMEFPFSLVRRAGQWLVPCNRGHVAHAFMSCDFRTQCRSENIHVQKCKLPAERDGTGLFATNMFECDDGAMLHYTLVCDLRHDCHDSSDEAFCIHTENCTGFRCHSGECVGKEKRCNWDRDCVDESDELLCDEAYRETTLYKFPHVYRLPPPVVLDISSTRTIIQRSLNGSEACPNTHFQCNEPYCLPVYMYCNGVVDCPHGEDERECHLHSCPGFYRCQSSAVCLHAEHLCDGRPQCPQHDDEWTCHMSCPEHCLCQGHAFWCPKVFNVTVYPHLRYLDAPGSGMKPHAFAESAYLVWLSLTRCRVRQVSRIGLQNLRKFDLSHNLIASIHMDVFWSLRNLRSLTLSNNPIVQIYRGTKSLNQTRLHTLDLSWSLLNAFSSETLSNFPKIRHLNISFCVIDVIPDAGFSHITQLQKVDLRGNPLTSYSLEVLKDLSDLQHVFTDDYRLCCEQTLPRLLTTEVQCISPNTHFSSCEDLMQYKEHRIIMAVIVFLAVVGNTASLVLKLCIRRNAMSSPMNVFMTNLNLMDLLMGVYASVISIADWTYRQRYFSIRQEWTSSNICKATGTVAFVSYEATLLAFCFMAVHGFMTIYYRRLAAKATQLFLFTVCATIWTSALLIGLIPLFVPSWKFHGYTDNCLAVPTSINTVEGRVYAFAVLVILHFILSCLTCVGQLSVVWLKYFRDDLNLSITERSMKIAEATRALPIIALDSVRRLAYCLMVLMGQAGLVPPEKIQSVYSILLVPVNSAINPLLYALSELHEKQRQRAEQRLLQRIAQKLAH